MRVFYRSSTSYNLTFDDSQESSTKVLGENLRRIFVERGVDFFDRKGHQLANENLTLENEDTSDTEPTEEEDSLVSQSMSVEELFKMRMEILPQLL